MNRCKTCKHWEPYQPDEYGAWRGAGICHKVPHIVDVADKKPDQNDDWLEYLELKPEHAGVIAAAQDGSGYRASLLTMPDFGCVQYEAKM